MEFNIVIPSNFYDQILIRNVCRVTLNVATFQNLGTLHWPGPTSFAMAGREEVESIKCCVPLQV